MFSRLAQITKHLSAPAAASTRRFTLGRMASADERNARTIHTAACLIIGDEVLGGKVWGQSLGHLNVSLTPR